MDINNSNKNEILVGHDLFRNNIDCDRKCDCNCDNENVSMRQCDIQQLENIIYPPKISKEMIKKILKNIQSVINDIIIKDYDNYLNILYYGFTEYLNNSLNDIIFSELNLATGKKRSDWCAHYSHDVSIIVESAIYGLIKTSKIGIFTETELADYIYKIIKFNIKIKLEHET